MGWTEACGTAHHWGRRCHALGLVPVLLPTPDVRPYVRRNQTDRTDTEALFEARRCGGILPVPVKTADQQALQSLHRVRAPWQSTRIARMNVVRGLLREYGLPLRAGAVTLHRVVPGLLEPTALVPLPALLRETLRMLVEEIRDLENRLKLVDRQLRAIADADPVATRLQTVPGVGVLVATALVGSVPHIHAFRRGRDFASWLGLTPREASSGLRRWQGGISKRGDVYWRALLTPGARSVLFNAKRRAQMHADRLSPLQRWGLSVAARRGSNKAVSALANKLARILWTVWHRDVDFSVTTPAAAWHQSRAAEKGSPSTQGAQATIDDHGAAGQTGTGRGREMTRPSRPLSSDWPPVCGFSMMARTRTVRASEAGCMTALTTRSAIATSTCSAGGVHVCLERHCAGRT